MTSPLLEIDALGFSYEPGEIILKNIGFTLNSGEMLGIIGPNGGGKTTLLKIIVGLLKKDEGVYKIKGSPVESYSHFPRELFAYVPQSTKLSDILPIRVRDVVEFGKIGRSPKRTPAQVLKIVGMDHKKDHLFNHLSGGEKQRVLLAKALYQDPQILVLDEPTKGLDSKGQDQLLFLLEEIIEKENAGVVLVDHNINQVIKHCDEILCLNKTHHWHDNKELLTKGVIEDIYHCEFEHLLIHDEGSIPSSKHKFCEIHGNDHGHHHSHKEKDR